MPPKPQLHILVVFQLFQNMASFAHPHAPPFASTFVAPAGRGRSPEPLLGPLLSGGSKAWPGQLTETD